MAANMNPKKNPMLTLDPMVRARNFDEVALGYGQETAIDEALRCLNCKNMPCVAGCPVNIHIPAFIEKIKGGDFEGAAQHYWYSRNRKKMQDLPKFNKI